MVSLLTIAALVVFKIVIRAVSKFEAPSVSVTETLMNMASFLSKAVFGANETLS